MSLGAWAAVGLLLISVSWLSAVLVLGYREATYDFNQEEPRASTTETGKHRHAKPVSRAQRRRRAAQSVEEHGAIVERIAARDPDGAEQAARQHILNAFRTRVELTSGNRRT